MTKVLVRMVFGSHLYGTATPDSDTDYKGVFFPSYEDIILGRIPRTLRLSSGAQNEKNTANDVDEEHYSLHYFVDLACKGETVALDMLHAGDSAILNDSETWRQMVARRHMFYTKNLRALVGYARRQAAKYGIKGSRLDDARKVLEFLQRVEQENPDIRLEDVWDQFPKGEHIRLEERTYPETVTVADVCGKKLQSTAKAKQYIETVERFVDAYGERARQAERNEGIDWKAVSHAFRAGYQVEGILVDGGFEYPLPQTDFIRQVKAGEVPYKEAGPMLTALIDRLEKLSEASSLPEKVNRRYWDEFIVNHLEEWVL